MMKKNDSKKIGDSKDTIVLTDKEMMFSIYQKQSGFMHQPYLVGETGSTAGKQFLVGGTPLTVGRGKDSHILLEDHLVSRNHAIIYPEGERIIIEDLNSRNGTFVNEEKIKKQELQPGDKIRIGKNLFKIEFP